jgi:hypothetical protein
MGVNAQTFPGATLEELLGLAQIYFPKNIQLGKVEAKAMVQKPDGEEGLVVNTNNLRIAQPARQLIVFVTHPTHDDAGTLFSHTSVAVLRYRSITLRFADSFGVAPPKWLTETLREQGGWQLQRCQRLAHCQQHQEATCGLWALANGLALLEGKSLYVPRTMAESDAFIAPWVARWKRMTKGG